MAKRPPLPKYNTPIGIARYPHLNKPDDRFDVEGKYKVDVILPADEDDTQELIAYLEGLRDKAYDEAVADGKAGPEKADVYSVELDESGDETGNIILKTSLNAIGKNKKGEKWENSPKLFDSLGNPLPPEIQIWSGSRLIVAGVVRPYAMTQDVRENGEKIKVTSCGVSLKCDGVQVIELISGGGQTASSFGFGKVSGGFETDATQAGFGDTSDERNPPVDDDEDF